MPPPSNTLLIEGTFSELAEELSQYIDNVAKSEDGAGLRALVEPSLATIREAEQSQETQSTDGAKVQAARDDLMKKIVTKASVLNGAPEKGIVDCRCCCRCWPDFSQSSQQLTISSYLSQANPRYKTNSSQDFANIYNNQ